ncbi:late competence protein ComER [Fictibacillus phosphorivorans]|uniref:late competence protein ComER n=1 Tax=Fictibacillus phosphorivorans TaxID=1221500 RepID=UPI00203D5CC0|nr:late competence protein ComER [Fictibacillus phosphorivorans]MCM3716893.1 late competence protein ComER [Fictibacillus phosphorivorans]MCM3774558.1 late competence protein ComER [Fictibacillus phosphorivorans]
MKIGIIGTGNMGSVLVASFIESSAITPTRLMVTNRTLSKAERLKHAYPKIKIGNKPEEVFRFADIVFICVKPHEFYSLLSTNKNYISKHQLLVSITSPISCEQLEDLLDCNIARAIPSINNRALSGSSLISFGSRCHPDYKEKLITLMSFISNPLEIDENITRVSSDIASCGPAFIGYVLQCLVNSAVNQTDITKAQATQLASDMIIGMGKLLEKEVYTLPTLIQKVCVKGGITGEGIKILSNDMDEVFDKVIQRTHEKYHEECEKVNQQFEVKEELK